jgi:TolB-like protein/class 3 adenylate cyclase
VPPERVDRKLAAILAADIAGYSRLAGADEERTLARLRALRGDLLDPAIAAHRGRVVKRTGDGLLSEFPSVVDAVRCAIEVQAGMSERNAGLPADRRIDFRIGIHVGDVMAESDGDLMGDGVNIAARLEGIAVPGGICISAMAFDAVQGKVDAAFVDLGEQHLKNIARPVRVFAVTMRAATPAADRSAALAEAGAPRLSIVVLPFDNIGSDKEQDYFVDGITESLTTDLSRIPGAFVIARNTAFTFRGKPVDARSIGRELGVRYVMEGSVQSGANRVRVNAQLIDAETGAHLWAERFDRPRADLFDMQDEITATLARTVGVELVAAESRRAERERPNTLDSVDLTMRGRAIFNQPLSPDRARQARVFFEAAVRLDERNVDALIGLAHTHAIELNDYFPSDRPADKIGAGVAAISKALVLAPESAYAHFVRGLLLYSQRAPERALREFESAIVLDRNLVGARVLAGAMKIFLGRAEETEADVREAMRLSPRDPYVASWYLFLGLADFHLGKFDHAVDRLRKAVEFNPAYARYKTLSPYLAAALAIVGHAAEAAEVCAAWLQSTPGITVSKLRAEAASANPVYLAGREPLYEGMRKAGMPEE